MELMEMLQSAAHELENKSIEEAEKNDFDVAAVHLKSAEIINELIAMQVAVKQNNRKEIQKFYYDTKTG